MRFILTSLVLCAAVTAQDLPCSALPISADGVYSGNTSSLTASGISQSCAAGSGSPDAWYVFTSVNGGLFHAETCGGATNYDTALALFSGPDCMTLAQDACNDDFCGLQSGLNFMTTAGTTYYLRVGGFNGANGDYDLTVSADGSVWGNPVVPQLSIAGSPFGLPTCSTVSLPTGPTFIFTEMRTGIPGAGVIMGFANSCAPGSAFAGTVNTFDLEYASLLWVVDGSGNNLQGSASFWNQFAVTDMSGSFALGFSAHLSAGPIGAFQAAVVDPAQLFGVDLTQALGVDAL